MNRTKLAVSLLLLGLLVASCVAIAGQRFSWYHDEAKDTLRILIHYDGIHEGKGQSTKGEEQLPEFVKNGDILVLDWWGHLEMGPIRAKLKNGNFLEQTVAKTLTSFQSQAAGHYVDPGGRIGALQVVTVPKVSRFVKQLNQLLNAATLAGKLADRNLPKTTELQKEEARNRHEWIVLDCHSIRVRIPMHPDEAPKAKSRFLSRMVSRAFAKKDEAHEKLVRRIVNQIATAPVSIIQEEEMLTLVVGYKKRTCTIRITTRDAYNDQLVAPVKKNVPTDLDRAFAAGLLAERGADGKRAPLPGLLGELDKWGPPEAKVRALLAVAKGKGVALPGLERGVARNKAFAALDQFGAAWNERGMIPKAPIETGDRDDDWLAWAKWYTVMTGRAPLGEGQ